MGLSAWKQYGTSRWALRVNPSSGNLHPTEAYVVWHGRVQHYAPREHALEQRCVLDAERMRREPSWTAADAFLVALTSIHWREAWKYGERAYRYCQHDAGHAIAAVACAAAGLGWRARLLDGASDPDLAVLLGVHLQQGIEAEQPDTVVDTLQTRGVNALLLWKHPHPSLPVADFPAARHLRETVIALPVHQELTSANLDQIADAVEDALR